MRAVALGRTSVLQSVRAAWRGAAAAVFLLVAGLAPGFAANDETLQVMVGATTTIELDGNPSTGYSWVLDAAGSENAELVSLADQGYAAAAAAEPGKRPVLGAPKKQRFEVTGVAAGEAKLKFDYVRSTREAAKSVDVVVEVIGASE